MATREEELRYAEEFGIDLTLIRESLTLSVPERVRRNFEAVAMMYAIQERTLTPAQRAVLAERERAQTCTNWGEWLAPLNAL